jgi:hypothetical protein
MACGWSFRTRARHRHSLSADTSKVSSGMTASHLAHGGGRAGGTSPALPVYFRNLPPPRP